MGWNTRPPQALLGWAGALPEVSGERSRPFVFITSEVPESERSGCWAASTVSRIQA